MPITNSIKRTAKTSLLLSLFALAPMGVWADYISHNFAQGKLEITTEQGKVTLKALSQNSIEAHYQKQGVKQLPSYALAQPQQWVAAQLQDKGETLELSAEGIVVEVQKAPFKLRYFSGGKLLLEEEAGFFAHDTIRGFRFQLQEQEKLLGGGARVLGMDRRGQRFPLYNRAHYGYETESSQMYYSLPVVMSSNKYMLLFDNSASGFMDLGKSEQEVMQFEASGGRTAYVVVAGDTYPKLVTHYTDITGKQPLPPRWALGNYASRFGYRNQQQVLDVVDGFIRDDIPLDALVFDLYWFGPDIKGHMGNLEWDKNAFPEPEKMIQTLKQKGVNTILITEPFVLTSSGKWQEAVAAKALAQNLAGQPKTFDFYFGNTGLVDVFNTQGQDWFNQNYQKLYQQGVTGWWGDLGEPEVHPADTIHTLDNGEKVTADEIHNVYGHQWAKMLYHKQLEMAPEQRPFIMMRAGFAGSQRYGMIPWTGDVNRSWGGLKPQVELGLQMGLMGLGYIHSDLGGFAGGETFDPELYIRWLQYGVFQPVYRPHAQEHIAPEPIFHDKQVKDIVREFIKLRYQLLPYNYTLAYQNHTLGLPMMRPLFFEDESNPQLMDNSQSYLWGDSFLVTPVTDAGVESVTVDLPQGVWFDYWSDKKYQGGKKQELATQLETLPVLVRAGAFIPMVAATQSTKAYDATNVTLHYYADVSVKQASGQMYEDDGATHDAVAKKQYQLLSFDAQQQGHALKLQLDQTGPGYQDMPANRNIELVIHNWQQIPTDIRLNGQSLDSQHYSWQQHSNLLTLKLDWQQKRLNLEVK